MPGFFQACLLRKAGLLCLVAAAVAPGCSRQSERPPAPAAVETTRAALPPATLPDLSQLDAAAQQQIRDQYSSLTSLLNTTTPSPTVAEAYGSVANLLLAADLFAAAEPFYLHAQDSQRDEFRWPYYLGQVYKVTSQPDKAIASFERAIELRPTDVASLVWLGNLYLDAGKPDMAESMFARALTAQPGTVAAMYGLGRAASAKGDQAKAVEYFERVLAADARASIVHYPLALAYRSLGNTAKAEEHLRQRGTVEVGPPDPLMVALRGLLQGAGAEEVRGTRALIGRDFAAAVKHFRAAVELAPGNAILRHKLGTALSLVGDTKGAVQQFEEAVRLFPTFAEAHYSLGVLLASTGRQAQAIEHLSAAVRYGPDYTEARLQLAEALGRSGQLQRSLAEYRQATEADPRSADARFGHALALARLQRYDEARNVLVEAARLFPEQSRFSDMLAQVDAARDRRR